MFSQYRLRNFKSFLDTSPIPLRPITLIYGPNSAGKSSIIQSLLLLKQTLEESDDPSAPLLPKGNLVDLRRIPGVCASSRFKCNILG